MNLSEQARRAAKMRSPKVTFACAHCGRVVATSTPVGRLIHHPRYCSATCYDAEQREKQAT